MEKKYEMTEETMELESGVILHRIKALINFRNVKKGDLGGWIEKEENLSHEGNCWLYHDAMVYGDAKVFGNAGVLSSARVFGDAVVCGNADVFDNAMVCGNADVSGAASVHGNARMYDNAIVCGTARVFSNAEVFGNAKVRGNAMISGNAKVFDNAEVSGAASVHDNARVYGDARLYGVAEVFDNAMIFGDSVIYGNIMIHENAVCKCILIHVDMGVDLSKNAYIESSNDYMTFGNIGSRTGGRATFYNTKDNGIYVKCGCFNGTLDEFKDEVIETHGDNKYAKEYLAAIELAKIKLSK